MSLGWWFFHFVFLMFNPKPWGYDPIWWTYFSNGLVQPEHLSHHLFQRKKSQLSNSWTCCPMDRRSSFFGGHFFRRWGWGSASGNSGCWIFFNGGICFFGGEGRHWFTGFLFEETCKMENANCSIISIGNCMFHVFGGDPEKGEKHHHQVVYLPIYP